MKFATDYPYTDPEKAARKLVEIANSVEPAQEWPHLHRTGQWEWLGMQRNAGQGQDVDRTEDVSKTAIREICGS
jgi:hypothetical protein